MSRKPRNDLTAEEVRERFNYNPETGEFTRLWQPPIHLFQGRLRADYCSGRYRFVVVRQVRYLAHRVAVLWMTGKWPPDQVDHRDKDKQNNRWANLRFANESNNQHNRTLQKNNTTGVKGVYRTKSGKFLAQITAKRKYYYLGCFDTSEEAKLAYKEAAKRLHGEFWSE